MFLNGLWTKLNNRDSPVGIWQQFTCPLNISQIHAVLWFSSNHLYPKWTSAIHFYFICRQTFFISYQSVIITVLFFLYFLNGKAVLFSSYFWMANSFSFSRFWYEHHFLITLSIYMNITSENYIIICVIIVWYLSFHWNLGLIRPYPFFITIYI